MRPAGKTASAAVFIVLAAGFAARAATPAAGRAAITLDLGLCGPESALETLPERFVVSVQRGHQRIRIESLPDGKIRVSRTHTGTGASNIKAFKDLQHLREADPDAYELLERTGLLSVPGRRSPQLRSKQDWQNFVRRKLKDAERDLQDLRERINRYEKDLRKWIEERRRYLPRPPEWRPRSWFRTPQAPSQTVRPRLRGITVQDDGGITIEILDEDGREVVLRFDSERALKQAAPKLYQRYKRLTEGGAE